jgi:copper resistance protein B
MCAATALADPRAGTPDDWDAPLPEPERYSLALADRLEYAVSDDEHTYTWDFQGWYGGDWNRLWWKTEGAGKRGGTPRDAEVQLLFSRMFAPFWDWQVGVRRDLRPQPERSYLVLGVQGIAPYEFAIDAALFASDDGDVTVRLEAEYELKLTQRLVLQPRLEVNASFSDVAERAIARGLNSTELGLRLRYELRREIAPYLGVSWNQAYGATADLAREAGAVTSEASLLAGIRFWF